MELAGRKTREVAKIGGDLLEQVGLGDRFETFPDKLSGGEQQRVAIARAIANNPQMLLADEPTGNLDPATSDRVFKSLHDLTRHEGVAALIATHNMGLIPYMDRVLTVRNGLIVPYTGV